jgi:hypothetical protein
MYYSVPLGTEIYEIKSNQSSSDSQNQPDADILKIKVADLDHEQ